MGEGRDKAYKYKEDVDQKYIWFSFNTERYREDTVGAYREGRKICR